MRIQDSIAIAVGSERAWELIADPASYPRVLSWVTSFEPEEPDREPGVGARYRMRLSVGSAEVGGLVEIVEYEQHRDIAWNNVTGIEQRGRIRLRDSGTGRVKLTIRMSYNAPGLVLGSIAELLSAPIVSASVSRSLQEVKRELEGTERPPEGPNPVAKLAHEADNIRILARAGLVAPMRPDKVARIALAGARWGASTATGVIVGAIRHPNRPMVIDELGTLSYSEVDRRTNAIANELAGDGICEGDRIGLLCRDHRGFLDGLLSAAKLGADVLLLNTSFAAPQITEVCKREEVAAIIYDEEFSELIHDAGKRRKRFVGWHDGDQNDDRTLDAVAEDGDPSAPAAPGRAGKITILTSGTTGLPKGAQRGATPRTLDPPAALLERIPLHEGQRAVCASGSALPGDLATRWMDEFGENLYNLYGSTEVSAVTLATPEDMRAAPGTAGKPARGSTVRLYDEHGGPTPQGDTGRIFVGNSMLFAGYTGGGSKDQIDGLMSTGDVGRFDEADRLFVQGRDDEMIVSGGENVFPKEVEDTLARHDAVAEAAAIGVEDEKFGQRLRAFVVLDSGKQATEAELKDHVKQNLARYKVPREVLFLDEIPRNPTGKMLKRELEEITVPDGTSGASQDSSGSRP
jgi:fatty-acyl-CoA synthase